MTATPQAGPTAFLVLELKLDGRNINPAYGIFSVEINHGTNTISYAEVVLTTGAKNDIDKMDRADFDVFNPGAVIEILTSFEKKTPISVFKGIIVRHALELNKESDFTLRLSCKHPAVKMSYNERDRYFLKQTDDAMMKSIIGAYSLPCTVAKTTEEYENMYQRMTTDWDFILFRAGRNGFIITMDKGEGLQIKRPEFSGKPVLKVAAGADIISFEGALNAEYQPPGVSASAWDPKTLTLIKSTSSEPVMNSQGNVSASSLSKKLGQSELNVISSTPMTKSELKILADSTLLRKRLNAFRGKVTFTGSATIKTGDIISIDGVGKKFSGDAFVTGVSHSMDSNGWRTTATFGLEDNPVWQNDQVYTTGVTSQVPAVQGIHLGIVTKTAEDPAGNYRVQVALPSASETATSLWARVSNFYATNNAGAFFLPEVGDEVVLGFIDGDARYPVVLGSLYNGKNAPPYTPGQANATKAIVTRSRMKIEFNEEKKIITLETPAGNSIVINENGKSVEIKDQSQNSIRLSSDGITMNSIKDINISAKGSIRIDAVSNVNITAKANVAMSGLNVNATANAGFTAKANATAELSASGTTTVKGSLVLIN